ncbi:MAG: redoxin domain-containing protein, partial [Acidimicrobiaceae bacterium]
PLLSDTDKTVAGLYSVVGLLGLPRRSVFVVDAKGVIKYAHRALLGVTFRPVSELIEAVAKA